MAPITSSDNLGISVLVLIVLFTVLASLTVWGRFWSRSKKKVSPAANDYIVLIALVFTWGIAILNVVGCTSAGYGQHAQFVTNGELFVLARISVAFPVLWGSSVAAVKIGILLLYLAIFRINHVFKIATYVLIAFVFCFGLSVIVAGLAMCRPIAKQWDPSIDGTCGNEILFYIITSGLNMGFDLIILVWPLPMLWGLQMRVSKKIELTLLFGVGLLACIVTALRIVTVTVDYNTALDALWATLEPDLGIILACVPVMQPVQSEFKNYLYSLTSGFRGTLHRSLRSSSVKIGGEKPLRGHTAVNRLYPLSNCDGTAEGMEPGTSLEQFDVERGHE